MVKIRFRQVEEKQITPKGEFSLKNYCYCERELICIECKKIIKFNELGWFCNNSKKLFCWDCFDKNPVICHKYGAFRNHADKLFTLVKEID